MQDKHLSRASEMKADISGHLHLFKKKHRFL